MSSQHFATLDKDSYLQSLRDDGKRRGRLGDISFDHFDEAVRKTFGPFLPLTGHLPNPSDPSTYSWDFSDTTMHVFELLGMLDYTDIDALLLKQYLDETIAKTHSDPEKQDDFYLPLNDMAGFKRHVMMLYDTIVSNVGNKFL